MLTKRYFNWMTAREEDMTENCLKRDLDLIHLDLM